MCRDNTGSSLEVCVFFYAWIGHGPLFSGLTWIDNMSNKQMNKLLNKCLIQVERLDCKFKEKAANVLRKNSSTKRGELLLKITLMHYKKIWL